MKIKLCIGVVLFAVATAWAQTNNLTTLLQQGLFEEQANRNLDAAIENYAVLARQFDKDRQIAATAVFRLGECYRAQGKTNEAAAQYQRILRDFADQKTLVTLSQQNLAGMGAQTETPVSNARQQQKELLAKQIALAEQDFADIKGKLGAKQSDTRAAERELLRLRQQLVALEAGNRVDLLDVASPAVSQEDKEIARIEKLIQTSPDLINSEDSQMATRTPLITAAWCGWSKVAAYLLEHGADVNRSAADVVQSRDLADAGRASPLLAAVAAGNKTMTQFLIEHGANVNFKGENNGVTPLHLAARKGFQAVVEVLLANHADVNATDKSGQTPLFSAVQGGQIKIIQMLMAAGAKPNVKDGKDNTVLNFAIKTSPEMVQALLAAGTDPNTVDAQGRTPLGYAVGRDSLEVVKMLLAAKADPNQGNQDPPLLVAIHKKDVAAVELLLQAGANPNAKGMVDLSSSTFSGGNTLYSKTPLSLAVSTRQLPVVQLLLKFKANPDDSQTDGKSLLFNALDSPEILTALLDAGAKVDARDALAARYNNKSLNWTPLMAAVENNSPAEVVKILLQHGANPNLQDDAFGDTPLGWCAGWGFERVPDLKVLELLLGHKADPNLSNFGGMTLLNKLKHRLKDASPSDQVAINKLADLLRQHGALDELPNFTRIRITRQGLTQPLEVFQAGTNLTNQFTLLETVMRFYNKEVWIGNNGRAAWEALPFPDFGRIIIRRPSQKIGGKEQEIKVSLLNSSNVVDCARDVPVEFGDVIEIPESVHALNAATPNPVRELEWNIQIAEPITGVQTVSFSEKLKALTAPNTSPYRTAAQCLQKSVQLVVAGETTTFKVNSWREGFLSQTLAKTEARSALRSSSDLSRVKVIRQTGKPAKPLVFFVDASGNGAGRDDLWLQDGDVIEVPEKK